MDTINRFRVEKLRRAVTVVLDDGRRLEGEIFLWSRAKARTTPEEPIDLLNEDEEFFPFFRDGEEMLLLAREHVARVESTAGEDDPELDFSEMPPGPDGLMGVEMTLADGTTLSGFVPLEKRGEQTRLLDFLNSYRKRFIPIFWGEHVCLVNRHQIASISQLT
ncbi:MAG TPA: hypothetical protein VJU87_11290 [Gemmatimonadaceae bacterium]|nr:hypothetical protein [Gemmatimonadaceae bacterium]